ncbi:unnamed protein product, partial [Rotaria sp. Silwood2]
MSNSESNDSFHNSNIPSDNFSISNSIATDEQLDSNETKELPDKINVQEENELIYLEEKQGIIVLEEGKAFASDWNRYNTSLEASTSTTSQSDSIFVVSFVGDTASGKSFLASHLPGIESFTFDESEHEGPTTANVIRLESTSILNTERKNNCLVLDIEGENGNSHPRILKCWANYMLPSEAAKKRRNAVGKYFPRLAYLLSNVIILVGQDDLFSNSRYVDRAYQFAVQAVADTQQNAHKPVLIMIQNRYPGPKRLSSEEATQKFFSTNPDAANLWMFFLNIHCFIFPFKHTGVMVNNNEHFNKQVNELQNLLTTTSEQHQGRLLPRLPWLLLTRKISQKLSKDEPINMHMILKDILIQEKTLDEDDILSFLFRKLYEQQNIHSIRWFHYCRDFAIEVLARFIAYRLRRHNFEGFNDLVKKECEDRLNDLWKLLDEYRPCEALYMGRGYVKEKDHPVFCYQHKGAHDTMHQTSEVVHGAS